MLNELTAFGAFIDIPADVSDINLQAVNAACNNDEDTLTQSQMLSAPDAAAFLKAQPTDVSGLEILVLFNMSQSPSCLYQPIF